MHCMLYGGFFLAMILKRSSIKFLVRPGERIFLSTSQTKAYTATSHSINACGLRFFIFKKPFEMILREGASPPPQGEREGFGASGEQGKKAFFDERSR